MSTELTDEAVLASLFESYAGCGSEDCDEAATHLLPCYHCHHTEAICTVHLMDLMDNGGQVVVFDEVTACGHICMQEYLHVLPL